MKVTTTKEINNRSVEMLVYGGSGVGKTSLVSTIPDDDNQVLIIDTDNGTFTLRDRAFNVVQPTSIKEVLDCLIELKQSNPYRWVVLDALSELSSMFLKELKNKHRDSRQAYMEMGDLVKQVISMIRSLDCNKYIITHQDQCQDENGAMLFTPALEGNALKQKLPQFFDIVLAYRLFKKDDGTVTRALQSSSEADQRFLCKDRSKALNKYEKPDIGVIWNKIYPEFTENKPLIEFPDIDEAKKVAKEFPGSTVQNVFDSVNVPEGNCQLEIDGKSWQGKVHMGSFVFSNGVERPLSDCPTNARFIINN